jgi:hypothetical protein
MVELYIKGAYTDIFEYVAHDDGSRTVDKIYSALQPSDAPFLLGRYAGMYVSKDGKDYQAVFPSEDLKKILASKEIAVPQEVWLLEGTYTEKETSSAAGIPAWIWIAGAALAIGGLIKMKN